MEIVIIALIPVKCASLSVDKVRAQIVRVVNERPILLKLEKSAHEVACSERETAHKAQKLKDKS